MTESCTDGEAIVAAETDEFYGQAVGANQTVTCGVGSKVPQEDDSFRSSDDDDDICGYELPLYEDVNNQAVLDSEPMDTGQSGGSENNEDLILENVQNFINMAYLQKTYSDVKHPLSDAEKVHIELD